MNFLQAKHPGIFSLILLNQQLLTTGRNEMRSSAWRIIQGCKRYQPPLSASSRRQLAKVSTAGWRQERLMISTCLPVILRNWYHSKSRRQAILVTTTIHTMHCLMNTIKEQMYYFLMRCLHRSGGH